MHSGKYALEKDGEKVHWLGSLVILDAVIQGFLWTHWMISNVNYLEGIVYVVLMKDALQTILVRGYSCGEEICSFYVFFYCLKREPLGLLK